MKPSMRKKIRTAKEKDELAYGIKLRLAAKKEDYIRNFFNGQYYLARCNMMVVQLNKGKIKESIDGCLKTRDLMLAEHDLMKMQAIQSLRNAYRTRQHLFKDFSWTAGDVLKLEQRYRKGQIVSDSYDDEPKKREHKAEFVKA